MQQHKVHREGKACGDDRVVLDRRVGVPTSYIHMDDCVCTMCGHVEVGGLFIVFCLSAIGCSKQWCSCTFSVMCLIYCTYVPVRVVCVYVCSVVLPYPYRRRLEEREVYVCVADSVPPDLAELAFHLHL